MRTSFTEVNNIMRTLPTGYYLGRAITVILREKERSCFYHPMSDSIVIGYPVIEKTLAELPDVDDVNRKEEIIRSVLYHELTHVVFTPARTFRDYASDLEHIFEDERIECLAHNVYKGVNFRETCMLANADKYKADPKDLDAAWFRFVRFREYPTEEMGKKLDNLILKHAGIYAANENVGSYFSDIRDLRQEFNQVYLDHINEDQGFENPANTRSQQGQGQSGNDGQSQQGNGSSNPQNNDGSSNNNNGQGQQGQSQSNGSGNGSGNQQNNGQGQGQQGQSNGSGNQQNSNGSSGQGQANNNGSSGAGHSAGTPDGHHVPESEQGNQQNGGQSQQGQNETEQAGQTGQQTEDKAQGLPEYTDLSSKNAGLENFQDRFKSLYQTKGFFNTKLYNDLDEIVNLKKRKDKKTGSAINCYSGALDTDAVINRDDYRWWSMQNRNGNIKRNSKVHFNLFIDHSGSMSSNEHAVNTFIQTLRRIPSKDFSFDVIGVGCQVDEWTTLDKEYTAFDGTEITKRMIEKVLKNPKHHPRGATVYNILLVDGSIGTGLDESGFLALNNPNCVIVTDTSNSRHIEYIKNNGGLRSKCIVTKDYTREFFDNVVKLLRQAL